MDTTEDMTGGASYNKDTYIGYLKVKKGGMKLVPGEIDNTIISKRNNILSKLEKVLLGGDKLKEKNIEKYFKALGGKYVRNDMCISGNTNNCNIGKKVSMGGADKLMKLGSAKYTPKLLEDKFKIAAPVLYEKYMNTKYNGGNNNKYNDNQELNNFRMDIGRHRYFSGGSDIELDKLRREIANLRN
jgi:hypothetical protein